MITFRSIGHLFATFLQVLTKISAAAPLVESVTSLIPGAGSAVAIENASFAVLGEIASLLAAGDQATKTKLTDAGLDANVIAMVEGLLKDVPMLTQLAKAL